MSTLGEEDPLDPNDPMSYAPPWMREEARSRSIASNETKLELPQRSVTSPSSFDTFSETVSKSLRNRLEPEVMHEPPGYNNRFGQWRELIPVAVRFAAAVGVSALVALLFVFMIPASRDHVQDSTASLVPASSKTASQTQAPRESESKPAESKPAESKPSLAQFETILAADRNAQPAENAKTHEMTHEQSEALLHQFVRWQQKLDSTDAPPP